MKNFYTRIIAGAMIFLAACLCVRESFLLANETKSAAQKQWSSFQQEIASYKERVDYINKVSDHVIAESDRLIEKFLLAHDLNQAEAVARTAIEKIKTFYDEVCALSAPDELIQFHRKIKESFLYQQMVYEAFLRSDDPARRSSKRMFLVSRLQAFTQLRRIYAVYHCPQSVIIPLDAIIHALEKEIVNLDQSR